MNVQDEIKALKERIAELEEQAKEEREFPILGDAYWYVDDTGLLWMSVFRKGGLSNDRLEFGNVFRTRNEAKFQAEKLKVEAELRKFSRPFKDNDNNYFIELYQFDKTLSIDSSEYFQTQGTIYFESTEKALQAMDTVGQDRIKKYIFGVEG